jgi:methyltransferase (TIGR00027 family)
LVPIDFEQQELGDVLAQAGFRTGVKTFVLWEGVTQYLGASAVDATFQYLSHAVASGSFIVFTYILRGIIDGSERVEASEKLLAELARQGEPWVFGIDPAELSRYLAAHGLQLVEDVGAEHYRTRYLDPVGRRMNLFSGERVAVAQVSETE